MKKIIVAEGIAKSFGEGAEKLQVLDGVSVEINEGEFVSVMGPSGSGKSTLLFALSGMDGVDGGRVTFDGQDLTLLKENELADIRRTRMGFVFQRPTLLRNLNLLDNIILPAMRDNRKNVAKITERARALMTKAGIADLEKRDITQDSCSVRTYAAHFWATRESSSVTSRLARSTRKPPRRLWRSFPQSPPTVRPLCWSRMMPEWRRGRSGLCLCATGRS